MARILRKPQRWRSKASGQSVQPFMSCIEQILAHAGAKANSPIITNSGITQKE
jgi:hypothetical protein